ncbi:hypothetical protein, partial [Brevibacillus borstelensis]|uniref:hypothetical protein n=1 Tax=Brevibacillus borstelensis TaxID=45462 RepID=UPI002041AE2B
VTSLLWGLWFGHRKTSPGRGEVLFLCSENLVAQGFRFMQKAHLKKHSLDTWVQGIVYFSNPDAEVNVNSEKIPVFSFEDGPNQIVRYVMDHEGETLSAEKARRIVNLLSNLTL